MFFFALEGCCNNIVFSSENIRFERMLVDFTKISFKLIAINHSANSLFTIIFYSSLILFSLRLIPRRLERRTYSYQKHTLPIKLRNLVNLIRKALNSGKSRALRLELRIWSLKLPILPIKLYSFFLFLLKGVGVPISSFKTTHNHRLLSLSSLVH